MNDWLLIGIKDGKFTVLSQTSEAGVRAVAGLLKDKQKKDGKLPYDKFITIRGNIVNI